jgi:hypothetical protein
MSKSVILLTASRDAALRVVREGECLRALPPLVEAARAYMEVAGQRSDLSERRIRALESALLSAEKALKGGP